MSVYFEMFQYDFLGWQYKHIYNVEAKWSENKVISHFKDNFYRTLNKEYWFPSIINTSWYVWYLCYDYYNIPEDMKFP